ncbi:Hypothetical protein R9X50_00336100 [Acrodontium crateriforme]|uniref:Uncharacterized protein n=1 Tax=Acrodontium crateriforme TaxID=150365 RepID=A0AAQ3M3V9_9PEZI|nr:Hypothetical protein R9X50_00336100 [Acrodontium crateriforme]
MCRKATCGTCQKATWFGCGLHLPTVFSQIPEAERCTCEPKVEKDGVKYPPMGSPLGGVVGAMKGVFGWGESKKDEL